MIKRDELIVLRAIMICHKRYLKPEECLLYTNLGRTQFAKKCTEYKVYKTNSGYYKKEDIDRMLAGVMPSNEEEMKKLKQKIKQT